MKNLNQDLRFERKWVFTNNYLDIYNKLHKSKFGFRTMYPDRYVNSIYFDDFSYSSVRENLDGSNKKMKIRLRWYGKNNFILKKPRLEFKIKKNFMNYKIINEMPNLNNLNIKNFKEMQLVNKAVNQFYDKKILKPVSTTNYIRSYFISSNNHIRSTVDINFKVSRFFNNFYSPIFKKFSKIILEMKYKKEFDDYIMININDISSRYSRNSKYIDSMINYYY